MHIDIAKLEELCSFESYKARKNIAAKKNPVKQARIRKEGRVKKHCYKQGAARRLSA